MFTVYAIESISRNYIYVDLKSNLQERLKNHNCEYNKTTKPYRPFKLIYQEYFDTREEARKREKYLKSGSGNGFLKSLRFRMTSCVTGPDFAKEQLRRAGDFGVLK